MPSTLTRPNLRKSRDSSLASALFHKPREVLAEKAWWRSMTR